MSHSRRKFLTDSAATWAGAALVPATARAALGATQGVSANDKIIVGAIGINGMGNGDLRSMLRVPGVECAALCDVDRSVLERRGAEISEATSVTPSLHNDFREVLDNDDIDVVIIGTPDHWHCLQMVMACQAGKDVYVEKPLANTIEEVGVMVDAARRYDRVVQVGQWQRSGPHWEDAVNFVRSGQLGRIRTVRAWAYMDWMPEVPSVPDEPAPPGVDYDMWLGPAPQRQFNRNRFHFNFRWFWDYAGGLMTDWGVHLVDMALYGMNATTPKSVVANGGKFAYPDDAEETPDTMQAIYEFDDFSMIWEHAVGIALGPFQRDHGVAFIGNNGTLVVDRGGWEIYPETESEGGRTIYKVPQMPRQNRQGRGDLDRHMENFVDCLRTRARPNCDVDVGAAVAKTCHLGNIAFRTDGKVRWDDASQTFPGNDKANELTRAHYRGPWQVPRV